MNMEVNAKKEVINYTPTEYFEYVKEKRNTITDKDLSLLYDSCLSLAKKYTITGQIKGLKKLIFQMESIEKEKKIVDLGINTFVYREDIENYIDNVSSNVVKIIELKNYERDIPDEIVDTIKKISHLFTDMYVVFTDYTGKIEKQVEKIRRDKDPILFGVIRDKNTDSMIERFYFLGDWVDEYCDLTFDKMINEIKRKNGIDKRKYVSTPRNIDELKEQLTMLEESKNGDFKVNPGKRRKPFTKFIRSVLRGKK